MKKDPDNLDNESAEDYNDISVEPELESASRLRGKSEKELREKLSACLKEKDDYLAGWQRAKADLINFKREAEETKKDFARYATTDLLTQVLPVLDSFDMALVHNAGDGLREIHGQLLAILRSNGLERIDVEGRPFDPTEHESLGSIRVENKNEDNVVMEVIQSGYRLHGKVLRPARVRIGEYVHDA